MSHEEARSAEVCYGCDNVMDVAPQRITDSLPKKHRTHLLYVCTDDDCANEWSNSDLHGVVQCSCGTFWGQVP